MKSVVSFLILFLVVINLKLNAQDKIDLLILNQNYPEALKQIDEKLSEKPEASLYLKKGLICNRLQKYQDAIEAFSDGLDYNPNSIGLNEEMAESQALLGNFHDAIKYYKKSNQLQPENLVIKGKLGRTYINLKKYENAYEVFSEIYAEDSTNVYWNKQLAFCAFQTMRKKQAIALYEKVLIQNPRDYKSYFNLARLYGNGEQEKIVNVLDQGLKQFPGDADLNLDYANFYFGSKQYDFAVEKFEDYFIAGGDSAYKTNLNYAISLYLSGNEDKALSQLRKLYFINPNDAFVLFYRSLCHKKMNDFEEAEGFMEGAIEMSYPDWLPEMYHHLGQIYGQQRKFKESVEALQKSHELDPANPEVLFEIATTYEEFNSNKTLALNYYRIYLKEAGTAGKNLNYALDRIERIKEDLFFEE